MSGSLVGGRSLLGDLLGAGGTAAVFRAVDTRGEAVVAVKVLHAHLATDAAAAERFLLEAQASTGLTHRNLVPVLDSGLDGPLVWLAQELVDGVTLAELVAATGPLPQADALAVLAGVLAGLTHAHVRGVLHLDLSASNV
ncbi:MAG: protein kinase, partial [Cellulomonadaceae bacterium]|nr:protein kinase [Cellulomonadaceae bacterium]